MIFQTSRDAFARAGNPAQCNSLEAEAPSALWFPNDKAYLDGLTGSLSTGTVGTVLRLLSVVVLELDVSEAVVITLPVLLLSSEPASANDASKPSSSARKETRANSKSLGFPLSVFIRHLPFGRLNKQDVKIKNVHLLKI
jgi:hypothetical protein